MTPSTEVVQAAYEAFGRGDIPAFLDYLADDVDWECAVPAHIPYHGPHLGKAGVAEFFAQVSRADEILAFEAREFIDAGEQVTVLGWERTRAQETGKVFESPWVHVFALRDGKIARWRGFYDTAARQPD